MDSQADAKQQRSLQDSSFHYNLVFSLAYCDWMTDPEKENQSVGDLHVATSAQPQKKTRKSLSFKKSKEKLSALLKDTNSRWLLSPTKPDQLEKAAEGVIPMNTRNSTNWAVQTFPTWAEQRNKREDGEKIPLDVLSCQDPGIMSFVMRAFVLEVRRANSEKYIKTRR